MKIIRLGVIGLLVGGFVASVFVWWFLYPLPGMDLRSFLKHIVVSAGIAGALIGLTIGLIIGVCKVHPVVPK